MTTSSQLPPPPPTAPRPARATWLRGCLFAVLLLGLVAAIVIALAIWAGMAGWKAVKPELESAIAETQKLGELSQLLEPEDQARAQAALALLLPDQENPQIDIATVLALIDPERSAEIQTTLAQLGVGRGDQRVTLEDMKQLLDPEQRAQLDLALFVLAHTTDGNATPTDENATELVSRLTPEEGEQLALAQSLLQRDPVQSPTKLPPEMMERAINMDREQLTPQQQALLDRLLESQAGLKN